MVWVFCYISACFFKKSLSDNTQRQYIRFFSFCIKSGGVFRNFNALKRWGKIFSVKLPFSCYFILDMPLIGSLIRILQYMEGCGKRAGDSSKESEQEETGTADVNDEDFHLKILKDICCELLSNMLQELTKVRINQILRGISGG